MKSKCKWLFLDFLMLGVLSLILNMLNIRICPFYRLFKIPCPGCGLTRGFLALLKLDILGHDDPTVIRMLQDITGIDPTKVPLDDKETMSIFSSTKALGVTPEQIHSQVGSFGIPEFGTKFVRRNASRHKTNNI